MYILILGNGIPTPTYPKQGAFAFDQACLLKKAGLPVVYGSIDLRSIRRKRPLGFLRTNKEGVSCYQVSLPLGSIPQGVKEKLGTRAFRRLLDRIMEEEGEAPLFVHAHFLKVGEVAAPVCERKGLALYLTEHSSLLHESPLNPGIKRRAKDLYPRIHRLITVSSSLQKNIRRETGFDSTVINNVIDTSLFVSSAGNKENEPFTFVSAGNLLPIKNYDVLLRAFAFHREHFPKSRLVIFGDGPEREKLEALAEDLHIREAVTMEGMVERATIARAYGKAQAFVLLSRKETFGVAFVEALASGLPVIASRCGGLDDYMKEDYGEVVEVGDAFAAGRAMDRMVKTIDSYDRDKMAREVAEKFSWGTIARELVDLYREDYPQLPEAQV
ncbi:glycosyltransferase [Kallipyga gabonensis]|uniref:glycosyltransferase n=1 Tax=Kallipyga gabonensis TaxID=1686287 RepID=UPI0006B587F9|nr:glycosyltransferase [Kallipyga gabonensis]